MEIKDEVVNKIKSLPQPTLIGVSGFGGSGKSTFAKLLGKMIDAPVIEVDTFQKGRRDRKPDYDYSLWEIMDYDRLEREVLEPFVAQRGETANGKRLIVEGVGLFRPELEKYFTYKIWIDCPVEEAIARGKKRDREEYQNPRDEEWDGVWKKNDQEYFEKCKPRENADLIVDNS